jgi:hypothetical protein
MALKVLHKSKSLSATKLEMSSKINKQRLDSAIKKLEEKQPSFKQP